MQNEGKIFLEVRNISKTFPGVKALDHISLTVKSGRVLALVGENGAGKSTLMKVLSGVYRMDEGEILIEGKPVQIKGPLESQHLGISIIYQELNLWLNLNIAENIFIGREPRKNGLVDKVEMHRQAGELLRQVGLDMDTKTLVASLSTAQKQMIEVAKALSFNARLIIMDEPTSSLTESETETLFEIVKSLRKRGVAIIFITHRMKEIFEISDEIVVMRDGELIASMDTAATTENEVISDMVGRSIDDIFAKEKAPIGDVALEVKNLSTRKFLKDIGFQLRKGEILGFAGLVGAGRSEVMRAIFGIDPRETGDIFIDGKRVKIRNTVDALRNGIGFVPEDRKEQALILSMTVRSNISLAALDSFKKKGFIDKEKEKKVAAGYIEKLEIKTPTDEQIVGNLSGGNQQKVVIGKWMETKPKILILDEPTRGIDVKTKKEIYMLMSRLAKQGVAIIMISSELPEVIGMSDRIIVMHEGRIKGELSQEEATQESVMMMALA
ncbi:sugar ABC transporter ATP-binding protein [Christensenella intestinihominis]|uniref:sugar ABC transporter ATP-binding protein n=1 Tax=Christensenella intestinihominis TaxID=1851429 RepID=UPI00082EDFDC|nr:sugar ABC transporter ATP-binding protein [Christensenella intestinihominis]